MGWHTAKVLQREVSSVLRTQSSSHLLHEHKQAILVTTYHFLLEEQVQDGKTCRYGMMGTVNDNKDVPLIMVGDTITFSNQHLGQLTVHFDKRP